MRKKIIFSLSLLIIMLSVFVINSSAVTHYFEIDGNTYALLDDAISAASDGDSIKLLSNIPLNTPISVSGKAITIDLNGFNMEVNVSKPESILATNGANLIIKDVNSSGGALTVHTVTGHYGIHADNATIEIVGSVDVDANGSTEPGYGAYANNGGKINFTGSLEGYDACAYADNGSEITINGNLDGGFGSRVEAHSGSKIIVNGNASVELVHPIKSNTNSEVIIKDLQYKGDENGLWVSNNSTIEIQGNTTRSSVSEVYNEMEYFLVLLENNTLNFSNFTSLDQKLGYITYSRGGSTLHVKNNWLCSIGRKAYKNLQYAFNAVNNNETINILKSFDWNGSIEIGDYQNRSDGKNVIWQTNGYDVELRGVDTDSIGYILRLYDSTLTVNGIGKFKLAASYSNDYILLEAISSTTNITSINASGEAVNARGIKATENSNITVEDSINTITNSINSNNSQIEVKNNVVSTNNTAIYSTNSSTTTIAGNIEGYNYGIRSFGTEVTVSGNISCSSIMGVGVAATDGALITVSGDLDSKSGVVIDNNNTLVTINGSLLSDEFGSIDGEVITESDKTRSGNYDVYQKTSSTATLKVFSPIYNPKLSLLTVQGATLLPSFNQDIFTYTSDVDNNVDEIVIEVMPNDSSETITINDLNATSTAISLEVGENSISIVVTATDNETTNEYILTITREDKEEKPKAPVSKPSPPEIKVITEKDAEKVDNYVEISPTIIDEKISSFVRPAIINKLIETALDTNGNESNDSLTLKYPNNESINSQRIILQKAGLLEIITKTNANLKISTKLADLVFNKESLENISNQLNTRNVTFNVNKNNDDINDETKQKYPNRPIYHISIDGSSKSLDNLGETKYNVTFPYILKDEEHKNAVIIKHIDENGNETLINALYNETTKSISASTNLVGTFVIDHVLTSFTDVDESNPYKDAIVYSAARKITNGTGDNLFSPKQKLTRAQFIVMLMDAFGIKQLDGYSVDNFTDAGTLYYSSYLHTARELGLVKGVGNGLYLPNKEVSNQEALSMLASILRNRGINLEAYGDESQSNILDLTSIAPWARRSVLELVNSQIALNHNGYLKPKTAVTREEFAQIIYNFLTK